MAEGTRDEGLVTTATAALGAIASNMAVQFLTGHPAGCVPTTTCFLSTWRGMHSILGRWCRAPDAPFVVLEETDEGRNDCMPRYRPIHYADIWVVAVVGGGSIRVHYDIR